MYKIADEIRKGMENWKMELTVVGQTLKDDEIQ